MPSHYGSNGGRGRSTGMGRTMNNRTARTTTSRTNATRRATRNAGNNRSMINRNNRRNASNLNTTLIQSNSNNVRRQTTGRRAGYIFVDTGEAYHGRVVELGGVHYSTKTGAREGTSREVKIGVPRHRAQRSIVSAGRRNGIRTTTRVPRRSTMSMGNRGGNDNPVTSLFTAPQTPRYYRPDGNIVAVGAPLHRHADGTVMTEHTMDGPDESVVVTTRSTSRSMDNRMRTNTTRMTTRRY
jgi:hypothetical protein